MPLWIPITLLAALLQNARSALQKRLLGRLGASGAAFTRFYAALPFALLFFFVALAVEGAAAAPTAGWAGAALVAALAQILATGALLKSFEHAGFAIGTGFSKTEPILAAVFGAVLLAEVPSLTAGVGIALGVGGVVLAGLGRAPGGAEGAAGRRAAALWGVAAAALFGMSAVGFRAATLALEEGSVALRAAQTLAFATAAQTAAMAAWMRWHAPEELAAALGLWRSAAWVGAAGAGASACWFMAMTLEPAAHVRALAQVELVFALATAALVFGEPLRARDWLGLALVGAGAALLLWATV
ncbi:MAG: EamA family transporter [Pseudomonadota bacterium]